MVQGHAEIIGRRLISIWPFIQTTPLIRKQNLIEYQIQEMPTLLKIDILFMDRVSKEKLIANIEKDGMVVYERGKTLRKAK